MMEAVSDERTEGAMRRREESNEVGMAVVWVWTDFDLVGFGLG